MALDRTYKFRLSKSLMYKLIRDSNSRGLTVSCHIRKVLEDYDKIIK